MRPTDSRHSPLRRPLLVALAGLPLLAVACEVAAALMPLANHLASVAVANWAQTHPQVGQRITELLTAFSEPTAKVETAPPAGTPPALALDVAMLKLDRDAEGAIVPMPFDDGEVLRDGRGDRAAGDKFKVTFRPNQPCYVYVISIDATGWPTPVFPGPESSLDNPLRADQQVTVGEGTRWYGLDQYRGIEQFYFMASLVRRPDIEELFAEFNAMQPRPETDTEVRRVTTPVVAKRGIYGTDVGEPAKVQDEAGGSHDVLPTEFLSRIGEVDLVVTRYFDHQ